MSADLYSVLDLQFDLIRFWESHAGLTLARRLVRIENSDAPEMYALRYRSDQVETLKKAEPFTVEAGICSVLEATSPSMPDWTMTRDMLPSLHGFIRFERPLRLPDINVDGKMRSSNISAITWNADVRHYQDHDYHLDTSHGRRGSAKMGANLAESFGGAAWIRIRSRYQEPAIRAGYLGNERAEGTFQQARLSSTRSNKPTAISRDSNSGHRKCPTTHTRYPSVLRALPLCTRNGTKLSTRMSGLCKTKESRRCSTALEERTGVLLGCVISQALTLNGILRMTRCDG